MAEDPPALLPLRLRAARQSREARRALGHAPVVSGVGGWIRTAAVGPDPLRVLLFGSGPLVGYGVRTRREAIDGALAVELATRTGRGVTIESRVRPDLPIEGAVASLGATGTATFRVAVWAPAYGEELRLLSWSRRRRLVRAMLAGFREISDVPLVLCLLPVPLGPHPRAVLRRARVARLNRILVAEAAAVSATAVATFRPYTPSELPTVLGPAFQRGLAEDIAATVLAAAITPVRSGGGGEGGGPRAGSAVQERRR